MQICNYFRGALTGEHVVRMTTEWSIVEGLRTCVGNWCFVGGGAMWLDLLFQQLDCLGEPVLVS